MTLFDRGRSGQYLYFSLVSAISGNIVTGASGAISGRRSLDGGSLSLLSGFVTEVSSGQGQYVANLFAEDVTGNCIGFLFTASGCVPVNYSVITQQNVSGKIYAASGVNATVPIASISGVNSVVPISSISGVNAVTTIASGTTFLASGQSVQIASGTFVTVPISSISGVNAVVPPANLSGVNVTVPIATISGTNAVVPPASLSGVNSIVPPANLSGVFASVPTASISGVNSVATVASGTLFLASGNTVGLFSGTQVLIASGTQITLASGALSGQFVTLLSGYSYTASGISVTASVGSGLFVTVPISTISGTNAVVPPANLSGVFASVPIATISGVNVVAASGAIYPASGTAGAIASGTVFLASGQSVAVNSGQMVALYSGQQTAVWSGTSVNVFSGTVSLTSGEVFVRIPQGVLTRDFTAFSGLVASGVSGRCVVNAERKLVNKWSLTVTSGYLTVYQENDSAVAYTQALTVASGAAPITSMDTD